ncbi:hypothetical protein ABZ814_29060 [Micromonospora musae]|uniref:hypothetical protein n=1 Tax=Micromonospora musae TaxID=1894970 RepID=UPI0033E9D319
MELTTICALLNSSQPLDAPLRAPEHVRQLSRVHSPVVTAVSGAIDIVDQEDVVPVSDLRVEVDADESALVLAGKNAAVPVKRNVRHHVQRMSGHD